MKNHDYITQDNEAEDRIYLHKELFPVSIRLLKSSQKYKEHIQGVLSYMEWTLQNKWEDYASTKDGGTYGISGANLGIPYNIIGWRSKGKFKYMLNPKIIKQSEEVFQTKSNCGSIKLSEKIPVVRYETVTVKWYDMKGKSQEADFSIKDGGSTVQHEIDHNNGILITDRFLEQGGRLTDIAHLFPKEIKEEPKASNFGKEGTLLGAKNEQLQQIVNSANNFVSNERKKELERDMTLKFQEEISSQEQWDLFVCYGKHKIPLTLQEYLAKKDTFFSNLTTEEKREIALQRIQQRSNYRLPVGGQVINQTQAIQEISDKSQLGEVLVDFELLVIKHFLYEPNGSPRSLVKIGGVSMRSCRVIDGRVGTKKKLNKQPPLSQFFEGENSSAATGRKVIYCDSCKSAVPVVSQRIVYPIKAIHSRWEGTSTIRVTIEKGGRILEKRLVYSSHYPALDACALDAIKIGSHASVFLSERTEIIDYTFQFVLSYNYGVPRGSINIFCRCLVCNHQAFISKVDCYSQTNHDLAID